MSTINAFQHNTDWAIFGTEIQWSCARLDCFASFTYLPTHSSSMLFCLGVLFILILCRVDGTIFPLMSILYKTFAQLNDLRARRGNVH